MNGSSETNPNPYSLGAAEVAAMYGVSKDTVRRWIKRGTVFAINTGTPERPSYRIDRTRLPGTEQAVSYPGSGNDAGDNSDDEIEDFLGDI